MTSKRKLGFWPILGLTLVALLLVWGSLRIWRAIQDQVKAVSDVTYAQVEEAIARGSSLTQAQLAHQIATFQGKKVLWTGTVEDVGADNTVYIDMDSLLYDVRFGLSPGEALKLSKGHRVTFVGVIHRIERFWLSVRVELRSVTIESATP